MILGFHYVKAVGRPPSEPILNVSMEEIVEVDDSSRVVEEWNRRGLMKTS